MTSLRWFVVKCSSQEIPYLAMSRYNQQTNEIRQKANCPHQNEFRRFEAYDWLISHVGGKSHSQDCGKFRSIANLIARRQAEKMTAKIPNEIMSTASSSANTPRKSNRNSNAAFDKPKIELPFSRNDDIDIIDGRRPIFRGKSRSKDDCGKVRSISDLIAKRQAEKMMAKTRNDVPKLFNETRSGLPPVPEKTAPPSPRPRRQLGGPRRDELSDLETPGISNRTSDVFDKPRVELPFSRNDDIDRYEIRRFEYGLPIIHGKSHSLDHGEVRCISDLIVKRQAEKMKAKAQNDLPKPFKETRPDLPSTQAETALPPSRPWRQLGVPGLDERDDGDDYYDEGSAQDHDPSFEGQRSSISEPRTMSEHSRDFAMIRDVSSLSAGSGNESSASSISVPTIDLSWATAASSSAKLPWKSNNAKFDKLKVELPFSRNDDIDDDRDDSMCDTNSSSRRSLHSLVDEERTDVDQSCSTSLNFTLRKMKAV